MKLKPDDILIVQYGDRGERDRKNGGYCSNPECVKVIFENDLYLKQTKKPTLNMCLAMAEFTQRSRRQNKGCKELTLNRFNALSLERAQVEREEEDFGGK